MKHNVLIRLFLPLLFLVTNVAAQTYQQRGVVRMITTSASSPITPVAGVKVAVGNNVSKATGSNGQFTMQVTKQFQVNGVTPGDEYVLALPTKGKTYYQSQNDLDVVVTTKAQKEADYKRLYAELKKKYRQQTAEINSLREELCDKLDEMQETDAEYARVKAQRDSIQALYRTYVENTEKIDEEIKKIAEGLAVTDYLSLDSIERRIYELKRQGEWRSITDLTREVMRGDAAAFLQEGIELERQKQEELKQAQLDKATRFNIMEEAIEAFKVQHLNDSVSKYYKILTDAVPENWEYLNQAGLFEFYFMANYSLSINYYNRAVSTNPTDSLLAANYNNIGMVYESLGDYPKALELYVKALMIEQTALSNNHLANIYHNIGGVYKSLGNLTQALEQYEKALNIFVATWGTNHPNVALSYNAIGGVYTNQGNSSKALEQYEKALNIFVVVWGTNHPDVAMCYNNIGAEYSSQKNYPKALEQYGKALKILLVVLGDNHPNIATCYNNIGCVYSYQEDYSNALEQYEKALKIKLAVFGDCHPAVAMSYNNIGYVYYHLGNFYKALDYCETALKIWLKFLPENHPNIITVKRSVNVIKENLKDR